MISESKRYKLGKMTCFLAVCKFKMHVWISMVVWKVARPLLNRRVSFRTARPPPPFPFTISLSANFWWPVSSRYTHNLPNVLFQFWLISVCESIGFRTRSSIAAYRQPWVYQPAP